MSRERVMTNLSKIKRAVAAAAICAAGYILQCALCGHIALGAVKPNLLVIIAASSGFMGGPLYGMLTGFFSGLLCDVQFGNVTGLYALIYMLLGYANGISKGLLAAKGDTKRLLALIGASGLIYGTAVYFFTFMLRGEFNFIYYLGHIIIPEALYTVIAAMVLSPLILYAGRKFKY